MKLEPCPFCGKVVKHTDIDNIHRGSWGLIHFCPVKGLDLGVCISVYGKNKAEVIERWNRRADNG